MRPEAGIMRRFDAESEERAVLMRMVQEHGLGIHKTSEWFKAHLPHLKMVDSSFGVDYTQDDNLTFALAGALEFGNRTYPGRLPLDSKWRDNQWIYTENPLPSKPLDKIVNSNNFSNLDFEAQFGEAGIG